MGVGDQTQMVRHSDKCLHQQRAISSLELVFMEYSLLYKFSRGVFEGHRRAWGTLSFRRTETAGSPDAGPRAPVEHCSSLSSYGSSLSPPVLAAPPPRPPRSLSSSQFCMCRGSEDKVTSITPHCTSGVILLRPRFHAPFLSFPGS